MTTFNCAHSTIINIIIIIFLNYYYYQSRWQSLGGQHGKGVDGLFEKVSFQMAFEGVESG